MLPGVDQIITSSNSFLNSRDKGAHLMKFGLAPTIDAIFIFYTSSLFLETKNTIISYSINILKSYVVSF